MNFDNSQPIWMQIYELILSRIASSEWAEGERIPSVRELGATLVVNPNTVMRTYERLTEENLIFNRRGIGYFVAEGAAAKALQESRREFLESQLPPLFERMRILGITPDELAQLFDKQQ